AGSWLKRMNADACRRDRPNKFGGDDATIFKLRYRERNRPRNHGLATDHVENEGSSRQKEGPRERGFSRASWLEVGPCEEGRLRKCRPQVWFCSGLTGLARLCLGGMMLKRS